MSKIILLKIKASGETFDCTVIHHLLNEDLTHTAVRTKQSFFCFHCSCNSSVANGAKSSLNGYVIGRRTKWMQSLGIEINWCINWWCIKNRCEKHQYKFQYFCCFSSKIQSFTSQKDLSLSNVTNFISVEDDHPLWGFLRNWPAFLQCYRVLHISFLPFCTIFFSSRLSDPWWHLAGTDHCHRWWLVVVLVCSSWHNKAWKHWCISHTAKQTWRNCLCPVSSGFYLSIHFYIEISFNSY